MTCWGNSAGHKKFLTIVAKSKTWQPTNEAWDADWWAANVTRNTSKVPLQCQVCDHVSATTTINNFVKQGSAACFCTNTVRWSSPAGHTRGIALFAKLSERLVPTEEYTDFEWWHKNIRNNTSRIEVACSTCGAVATTTIMKLLEAGTMRCHCNGHVLFSSASGHERFLGFFDAADCGLTLEPHVRSYDWWKRNVENDVSCVAVRCKQCNTVSTTTSIHNILGTGRCACTCHKKTEGIVARWLAHFLQSHYPDATFRREARFAECKNVRTLPFDFCITQSNSGRCMVLELDGPQHFKPWFGPESFQRTLNNDVKKEAWAQQHGITMVRILQQTVWTANWDWKRFVADRIRTFMESSASEGLCVQPCTAEYTTGEYAARRQSQ